MCIRDSIPPHLNADQINKTRDLLIEEADHLWAKRPNSDLIFAGDFNHFNVVDFCKDLDLTDIVKKPTRANNILDHILVSRGLREAYQVSNVRYNAPIANADHLTVLVSPVEHLKCGDLRVKELQTGTTTLSHANSEHAETKWHKIYDFRQSHLDLLWFRANSIDWGMLLKDSSDVDQMWEIILNSLIQLLDECIPTRLVPITAHDKAWITPITKLLILDKWSAFRAQNWPKYNHLKMKVKVEVAKAKAIWANKLMRTTNGLWKLVRNQRKKQVCGFQTNSVDDLLNTLTNDITKHFSQPTGTSPFPAESDEAHDGDADYGNCLVEDWCPTISQFMVKRKLMRCSPKKACGIDGIPSKIYVELADVIDKPLAQLFNRSFKDKRFPSIWKKAVIVPIPKTNPPDVSKVRYISLLPLPSKLCESFVLDNLRQTFESAYGHEQHGFRRNASTTTALLKVHNSATCLYDDINVPSFGIISFDLSRAFDCVDYSLAIKHLSLIHI